MIRFSENIQALQPSATIALSARVRELVAAGRDILNMTAGEPDFDTPSFIQEAGIRAIRSGKTRYTASAGIPELRKAIAADLQRVSPRQPSIDPAGVVVSSGAKECLFNLCFTLFGPGDRVIVPGPYWTTYPEQIALARAQPVEVFGSDENGCKVTPDQLEAGAGGKVAGLILNSPGNPTGAVYTLEELESIVRWAVERDAWVISDEIYRRIHRGGTMAPGLLDLDPGLLSKAVVVDGASKAFAMTGWRIGFLYGPPAVAGKAAALQSQTTTHPAAPSQYAALAAYSATDVEMEEYRTMLEAFERRRQRVIALFHQYLPGVPFVEPHGAFYLWFRADALGGGDQAASIVSERLLEEVGVAVVPGAAFGDDRYARLSYACSEATLQDAVERIATFHRG
jgi:aspartate aminotransferase